MKFGKKLLAAVAPRFHNFCVNYKDLKDLFANQITTTMEKVIVAGDAEEIAARRFHELFESEMEKINIFCALEEEALRARVLTDLEISKLGTAVAELEAFVRMNILAFHKLAKQFDKTWKSKVSIWVDAEISRQPFALIDFNFFLKQLKSPGENLEISSRQKLICWVDPEFAFPLKVHFVLSGLNLEISSQPVEEKFPGLGSKSCKRSKFTGQFGTVIFDEFVIFDPSPPGSPSALLDLEISSPEWLSDLLARPGVSAVADFTAEAHLSGLAPWSLRISPTATQSIPIALPPKVLETSKPGIIKSPLPPVRDALVRVEPKSFFSNERLFLDWIHVSVILAALVSLTENKLLQLLLTPLPLAVLVWGTWKFLLRRDALIKKAAVGYDGSTGPILIAVAVAVVGGSFFAT